MNPTLPPDPPQVRSAAPPKIRVRGLFKRFGSKQVLDGLDLDIGQGELVVVIGGSGTGKSVLLKCILGILRPDRGSIEIDGQEVTTLSRGAREQVMHKFGMLFQGSALFDSLPVWENVAFGLLQIKKLDRAEAKERASRSWAGSGCRRRSPTCRRPSSQAACRSGSGSRARSRPSPRSCSSTSRPPGSTRSWRM